MADESKPSPLPKGVEDAVLNRDQLARALGCSLPTIDRWVAEGMPILSKGRNGQSYEFQLSTCWRWKLNRDDEQVKADEAAERAVQQMRLSLVGGSVGSDEQRALSPKERAAILAEEYEWTRLAKARGEVVDFKRVTDLIEELLALVRDGVISLPDRLQREANLSNRQVEHAVTACDDLLGEMVGKARAELAQLGGERQSNGESHMDLH